MRSRNVRNPWFCKPGQISDRRFGNEPKAALTVELAAKREKAETTRVERNKSDCWPAMVRVAAALPSAQPALFCEIRRSHVEKMIVHGAMTTASFHLIGERFRRLVRQLKKKGLS